LNTQARLDHIALVGPMTECEAEMTHESEHRVIVGEDVGDFVCHVGNQCQIYWFVAHVHSLA
jgi:hypothetical protein